jgi:hypothetical protein
MLGRGGCPCHGPCVLSACFCSDDALACPSISLSHSPTLHNHLPGHGGLLPQRPVLSGRHITHRGALLGLGRRHSPLRCFPGKGLHGGCLRGRGLGAEAQGCARSCCDVCSSGVCVHAARGLDARPDGVCVCACCACVYDMSLGLRAEVNDHPSFQSKLLIARCLSFALADTRQTRMPGVCLSTQSRVRPTSLAPPFRSWRRACT